MKKLIVAVSLIAFVCMLSACGGGKKKAAVTEAQQDSLLMVELVNEVDSLFALISNKLPTHPFIDIKNGNFTLSEKDKKVKPDYLLPLAKADELQTLGQKNIALKIYVIDRAIAEVYGMPTDGYDAVIARLLADVNVKEFPFREGIDWKAPNAPEVFLERTNAVIEEQKAKGELNYFMERVATSLIECTYILSQNPELYVTPLSDQNIADITFESLIMADIIDRMAVRFPDMAPVKAAMDVVRLVNATDKAQFIEQLKVLKPKLTEARNNILK